MQNKRKSMLKEFLSHRDEFRLLYSGKLTKREGWKNVREHDVVQLFGAKVLGNLWGLPDDEQQIFESVAIIHDWDKRLSKFPDEFTSEEKEKARIILEKINPDKNLMAATGPDFFEKVLYTEVSMLEFLQCYLDDITKGNEIVSIDERIDDVQARSGGLYDSELWTKRLGGRKFWDLVREMEHEVEKIIFKRLVENGVEINSPEDIPNLIRTKVAEIYKT